MDNKNINDDEILQFLREEYFYLQKSIDESDNKALTIKGWSITFSLAIIATAFVEQEVLLLIISGFSAVLFWVIEWYWKLFQNANYQRLYDIERFISGKDMENFRNLNSTGSWTYNFKNIGTRKKFKMLFLPQIHLPYSIILLGNIFLVILNRYWHYV